jgi:hypothetical protein
MFDLKSYVNGSNCIVIATDQANLLLGPGCYVYVSSDAFGLSGASAAWRYAKSFETKE